MDVALLGLLLLFLALIFMGIFICDPIERIEKDLSKIKKHLGIKDDEE